MNKLKELRAKKVKLLEEMKAILDMADSEERSITEDEETLYDEKSAQLEQVEKEIEEAEKAETRKAELEAKIEESRQVSNPLPFRPVTYRAEDPKEFESLGEFFFSVRFNRNDPRLYDLYHEAETRAQSMGVGSEGGFAVPTQFIGTLLEVTPQEAIFRPRCTVIPAGSPPDASVSMPALDQGASKNMYGGVQVQWIGEGATKPETDAALREVTLEPNEVAGHIVTTDKLLRNWGAASAVLERLLRNAVIGSEETAFYNGTGVGQPLGLLSNPGRIDYARATANQISFADVSGMYARLLMGRGTTPVWIASQTCIPQLVNIRDTGNNNLWVQSAADGLPPTLYGYPVLFHERAVGLGTAGDLILADLSYYLIKDGSGPFVATSEHFYFTSNKTVFKVFWNVDGQSWLNEPIPLEGSTSNTVSPFIVLN